MKKVINWDKHFTYWQLVKYVLYLKLLVYSARLNIIAIMTNSLASVIKL